MSGLGIEAVGGLGEMGRHHLIVDLDGGSVVLDAGARFPDEPTLGIERTFSPFDPAMKRRQVGRLRAIVLTHGHQDHIGGVVELAALLPGVPIVGHPFVLSLVERNWSRNGGREPLTLRAAEPGAWVDLGGVEARWVRVTHSIPAAASVAVRGGGRTVVHSGDFRVDPRPILGEPTDWHGLREIASEGVDVALVDSTGAGRAGRTRSETEVEAALATRLASSPGRTFVTLFASHVERLYALQRVCDAQGRPFAAYGAGLHAHWEIARRHGLLPSSAALPDLVAARALGDNVVIAVTGSQLEPFSPMWRICRGEDAQVRIATGDTVLWSARVVPGGERAVAEGVNRLIEQGASVDAPWDGGAALHTSGHGHQEEIDEWVGAVDPRVVVPVHGEAWHLERHGAAWAHRRFVQGLRSGERLDLAGDLPQRTKVDDPGVPVHLTGSLLVRDGESLWKERRRAGLAGVGVAFLTPTEGGWTVRICTVGVFADARREEDERAVTRDLQRSLQDDPPGNMEEAQTRAARTFARLLRDRTGQRVPCRVDVAGVVERA